MTDRHFSEDEDLLGRFVLGRLGPEERLRCDDHLRTCEICRMAVMRERTIAAGAKRLGREELRRRLREATGSVPAAGLPWQQIVGIAAVVVIVIGTGVLYRWWSESSDVTSHSTGPMMTEERLQKPAVSAPTEAENRPQKTDIGEHQEPSLTTADGRATDVEKSAPAPLTSGGKDGLARAAQTEHESGAARRDKMNREEGKDAKELLAAAPGKQVSAEQTQQQTWLQGVVTPRPASKGPALGQSPRANALKGRETDAVAAKKTETVADAAGNDYTVSQRPLSALPGSRQLGHPRGTVETLLEEQDHRSRLTLFLDSLFSEEELQQATVEVVTEDSIVVRLRDRMIGYRLPETWVQEKAKATRQKR
jgi:hypothetical protein